MSDSNETLLDVAKAIEQHAKEEDKQVTPIPVGVARYRVDIEKNNTVEQIFLTNKESSVAPKFSDNSRNVYKNTSMGGFLIKQGVGSGTYIAPKNVRYKVEVMTKSTFSRDKNGSINDLEIWLSPSGSYRFATLKSLLACYSEDSKKLEEERKSIKEIEAKQKELRLKREKIQAEAARLAEEQRLAEEEEIRRKREEALAEAKRLEEEERRKEEERQRKLEEMKRLEACINETKSKIEYIKSFVRNDVSLRSQHILDASQEDAKRSNVYNGVPVLIDGGPGTGKTTTTIQRLKFLLSKDALNDYSDLSEREKDAITQPESVDYNWLFFSPNELLLQYLRENMREESLNAKDCNTITIDKFRKNMLRDYKLFTPDTDGPFKLYKFEKGEKETRLINNPKQAVAEFEKFCVEQLKKVLNDAYQLNTSNYGWHNIALQLKAICQKASSAKDMYQVMQIFNSLEDNQKDQIRYEEDHQSALLKDVAYDVRALVLENSEVKNAVQALFEKWNKEKIQISEDQDTDDEDEEEEYSKRLPFDAVLALQLPKLIKALALKKIDTKRSLTKRQNELKDLVGKFIDDESLRQVGNVAWFVKNYASITKGLQRNILSKIPKFYKAYRRTLLEGKTDVYDKDLLAKLINKDGNKHLHKDEVDLLVGFINNILHQIHKRSSLRFEKMTHKYVQAFRNNCKYVIGVDEATDYSLLDYYLIYSFRNVKYSSVTLCGDLMQGVTENGITDWNDVMDFVMPNLKIIELKVSYRQLPTLLNLAREMYNDVQGHYPAYYSDKKHDENEPLPIAYVSDDEQDKADWICDRIIDVWKVFDEKMPSVAIFVGDDTDIDEFVERINDTEKLSSIDVVNCSDGRTINRKDVVRVFRLSEVKGMEFEVVFFHNLDSALQESNTQLMTRYIYVGLSRATTHMAATFSDENAAKGTLKYFVTNPNQYNWEL